ncbi:MAG TPA: enoyl-CoA hydratase/isomerase family protein [Desulfuromonadales bacterium]|nr:enoyl-CoA hydratase/isomerase family protein [Desulfuromonadales bacterium]
MPETFSTLQISPDGLAILSIPGSQGASERQLLEAIHKRITALAARHDINAIILTAAEREFCRCSPVKSGTLYDMAALSGFGQQVMFNLEKCTKPCIAVIEGTCAGIGLELALAADFIVASQSACFGFPAIAEGRIPFCGGSQRLSRLVGKSKAKEMIYSGEMISAEEAHRIGLINRLYPVGEALPRSQELLQLICTRSPNAIRVGGEVVNAGYDIDLQTACLLERDAFALCFSSFDQHEGMQAFLDKRPPQFKGE